MNDIYENKRTAHTFNHILNGRWHTGKTPDISGQLNVEYGIVKLTGMNSNSKVLDFGCGQGLVTYDYHVLSRGATVYGVTNNNHQILEAQRLVSPLTSRVHFRLVEEGILPFSCNMFDIVVCTESLCHLSASERSSILQEFKRVLKPQGQIALEDWFHVQPDSSNAKNINKAYGTHITKVQDYIDDLKSTGFIIADVEPMIVQWNLNSINTLLNTTWYSFVYPELILHNPFKVKKKLLNKKLIEAGKLLQNNNFYIAIIHATFSI